MRTSSSSRNIIFIAITLIVVFLGVYFILAPQETNAHEKPYGTRYYIECYSGGEEIYGGIGYVTTWGGTYVSFNDVHGEKYYRVYNAACVLMEAKDE